MTDFIVVFYCMTSIKITLTIYLLLSDRRWQGHQDVKRLKGALHAQGRVVSFLGYTFSVRWALLCVDNPLIIIM